MDESTPFPHSDLPRSSDSIIKGEELHGGDSFTGGKLSDDRGGVVTARGTAEGLVVRVDGRVGEDNVRRALFDFLSARRGFLSGQLISLEWVGSKPAESFVTEISETLKRDFDIGVNSSKLREGAKGAASLSSKIETSRSSAPQQVEDKSAAGLFAGVRTLGLREEVSNSSKSSQAKHEADTIASFDWDEADSRTIFATLRSGQKIETEHSLILIGDVNSGAELIAGGDIFVLGTLRGLAHAGAYDETGGGRVVMALNLVPTQLRIGSIISRGPSENSRVPEVARVDGNMIVVEPFSGRMFTGRR